MKASATLKQISGHLNISISTVSRALKDHPDVSPETKKRVKALATLLDYEPNSFAVSLRKKHSNVFAIIVPEIGNFFYHDFITAIEEEARKTGYIVLVLQSMNDPEIEESNLRLSRLSQVAGIFIAITEHTTQIEPFLKMKEYDIPILFFDKTLPNNRFNSVCMADENCGRLAAQKMLDQPLKNILAVFGNPNLSITSLRKKGFNQIISENPTPVSVTYSYANSFDQARVIVEDYFSANTPDDTGVFCMSDEILCGVLKGFWHKRLTYPNPLKILAISSGFFPSLFSPEIPYVKTSGYNLGKHSFEQMRVLINSPNEVSEKYLEPVFIPA